jgi:beta-xylosidase
VGKGWQTVLRSKNIYGPYEKKVVLETGSTSVNGPHQGALVDTPEGEWWFYHFQQSGALGRVVHLQPVHWANNWPVCGVDIDRNGIGEPVYVWKKPATGKTPAIHAPQSDDEFNAPALGLQWQFNHNPDNTAWSLTEKSGYLSIKALKSESFLRAKNTLTQKTMGSSGEAVVALDLSKIAEHQKAGLCSFGSLYSLIGIYRTEGKNYLFFETNEELFSQPRQSGGRINHFDTSKNYIEKQSITAKVIYLKVKLDFVTNKNHFYYSTDNKQFVPIGNDFRAVYSFWKGSRIGLFSYNEAKDEGTALFNWFHYDYDGPK